MYPVGAVSAAWYVNAPVVIDHAAKAKLTTSAAGWPGTGKGLLPLKVPTNNGSVEGEFVVNPTIVICKMLVTGVVAMKSPTLTEAGPSGPVDEPTVVTFPAASLTWSGKVFEFRKSIVP